MGFSPNQSFAWCHDLTAGVNNSDLFRFNQDKATEVPGAFTTLYQIFNNPDPTSTTRGKVLRVYISNGSASNEEAARRLILRKNNPGVNPSGTLTYSFSPMYIRFRFAIDYDGTIASGKRMKFFRGQVAEPGVPEIQIAYHNDGSSDSLAVFLNSQSGSGWQRPGTPITVTKNRWVEGRLYWKSHTGGAANGVCHFEVDTGSGWQTVVNITHSTTTKLNYVELMAGLNQAGATNLESFWDWIGFSETSFAAIGDSYDPFNACMVGDTGHDTAKVRVLVRENYYSPATMYARVVYGTDPTLTTGTSASSWTAIPTYAAGYNTLAVTLSSLTPGTRYYWKVEVSDDSGGSGTIEDESDIRTFQTLPTPGTNTSFSFGFGSCIDQWGSAIPSTGLDAVVANHSDILFYAILDDYIYESGQEYTVDADGLEGDPADYFRRYLDTHEDRSFVSLTKATAIWLQWGDHEVANDYDGGWRTDNVNTADTAQAHGSVNNAFTGTTLTRQEVFDNASEVYQALCGSLMISPANTTTRDYYRRKVIGGRTLVPILDTRSRATDQSSPGAGDATLMDATQVSWFNGEMTANPSRDIVMILSPTVWQPILSNQDTNWAAENFGHPDALPQQLSIISTWNADPTAQQKKACVLSGDLHIPGYCGRRWTAGNNDDSLILQYEFCASPINQKLNNNRPSNTFYDDPTGARTLKAGILYHYDRDNLAWADNTLAKTSGGIVTINENTGTVRFRQYDDDGDSLFDSGNLQLVSAAPTPSSPTSSSRSVRGSKGRLRGRLSRYRSA